MQRRTLLKGAASTTALGALGMRRPQMKAAAQSARSMQQQTPRYEIESFFVSDQFVWSNDQNWRGGAYAIAKDGTIAGTTVNNGILTPTVWDANLVPSYPDLGAHAGYNVSLYLVAHAGTMVGRVVPIGEFYTEEAAQGVDSTNPPLLYWADGMLVESMTGSLVGNSGMNDLLLDGSVIGQFDNAPTIWRNGEMEVLEVPADFVAGSLRAANTLGDVAGSYYRSVEPDLIGPAPFVRTASGEETVYDAPMATGPDAPGRLWAAHLSDNGSIALYGRSETDVFGFGVRYESDGSQQSISDLNGEGLQFRDSNAQGVLVGQSPLNGIPIPTMWVDDQPVMIADLIVPGPDLLFTEVYGINDDGVLVGEARDSAGTYHHVILRPV